MTAKVELLTPSGGKVILDPTNTAVDRVLTLPAVAGTVVNNTTLRTELNATGSAPIFACRAFVGFNGAGTVAIRESGNVSSITDNGTGDYTVNFITAMPDILYTVVTSGNIGAATSSTRTCSPFNYIVGSFRIQCFNTHAGVTSSADFPNVNAVVLR